MTPLPYPVRCINENVGSYFGTYGGHPRHMPGVPMKAQNTVDDSVYVPVDAVVRQLVRVCAVARNASVVV